jgi:hypothetical protein
MLGYGNVSLRPQVLLRLFQYRCVGFNARLPITSFGMLARPPVCPTTVALGLPKGSPTVPQREWLLTLYRHLAGGAGARAPFHQSSPHTALHREWFGVFNGKTY